MRYRIAFFVAIVATSIALGGALAHLFELINKMALGRDEYFIVQKIYYGWNQLAYVLSIEATALLVLMIMARYNWALLRPLLIAFISFLAAQALFWIYTSPANQATDNWTNIPENWATLRTQWEYSHAAGAILQLCVLCALVYAALVPLCREKPPC